jgi:hypothetical protein
MYEELHQMTNSKSMTPEAVQKKMILVQLLGAPGTIMVGLALYGIFGAKGEAFWPPLNDTSVTYNMLGIGAMIIAWETFQTLKLAKLKKTLSD